MHRTLRCWTEVDLDALRSNLAWIRFLAGPDRRVITVVKADAYGHGLRHIAALLMQSGTDMFGVANLEEARAIRAVGAGWPILMLGACLPQEVSVAVKETVRPTISSLEEAVLFSREAAKQKRLVNIHIKIDTGMSRLGVTADSALELIQKVLQLPGLSVEGICTHLAAAEDDARFTRAQQTRFERIVVAARAQGVRFEWVHTSNSAGLLFQKEHVCNAIRPGLIVYGVIPPGSRRVSATVLERLSPVLTWKSRIGLIKTIQAGASVSYGRTCKVKKATRVGVVTAGYGDGFMRCAGNQGRVLVGGALCRVLGRVTMDQMVVDLSQVPATKIGDEVVLVGKQGGTEITACNLADWCGTVPWEILTNITYRVPRLYQGGQAS